LRRHQRAVGAGLACRRRPLHKIVVYGCDLVSPKFSAGW
jgi:hypothetical protein